MTAPPTTWAPQQPQVLVHGGRQGAVTPLPLPTGRTVAAADLEYLAFEGGGGKGWAYLGALQAIDRLGAPSKSKLADLTGFAGASAGAITALLLSIGYTPADLEAFLTTTDFNKWWEREDRKSRVAPVVAGAYRHVDTSLVESAMETALTASAVGLSALAAGSTWGKGRPEPIPTVLATLPMVAVHLADDLGGFPGQAPRNLLHDLIVTKVKARRAADRALEEAMNRQPDDYWSNGYLTFAGHKRVFGKHLVVTGSNLSTRETVLFSANKTPDFPVADAVRISMGLPYVFKPYRLAGPNPPAGVYVDGGLFDNLPFQAVADDTRDPAALSHTIALRLDLPTTTKIDTISDMLYASVFNGFMGTGESQALAYRDQMIGLDTSPLGDGFMAMINFAPDPKAVAAVTASSRKAVRDYFAP